MNDAEIKYLWKAHDEKLDKLLFLNRVMATEITKTKAGSMLSRAKPVKYLGIIIGVPYLLILAFLCFIGWKSGSIFFLVSMGAISVFTAIALGTYVYHLVLMRQASLADSVVEMQEKIALLKTSTIRALRIVILQLPFWTTWYISLDIIKNGSPVYWIVNTIVTCLFTWTAIWFFRNIKVENLDKRWMKWLFSDAEWNSITKAGDLLQQIEDYRNTEIN